MLTVYGIKNCSTMQKTFSWLESQGIAFQFHDYKKQSIDEKTLRRWSKKLGWEVLLNKRGTTWRKLSAAEQNIASADDAIALMQANTSLIKRPVIQLDNTLLIGFDDNEIAAAVAK